MHCRASAQPCHAPACRRHLPRHVQVHEDEVERIGPAARDDVLQRLLAVPRLRQLRVTHARQDAGRHLLARTQEPSELVFWFKIQGDPKPLKVVWLGCPRGLRLLAVSCLRPTQATHACQDVLVAPHACAWAFRISERAGGTAMPRLYSMSCRP